MRDVYGGSGMIAAPGSTYKAQTDEAIVHSAGHSPYALPRQEEFAKVIRQPRVFEQYGMCPMGRFLLAARRDSGAVGGARRAAAVHRRRGPAGSHGHCNGRVRSCSANATCSIFAVRSSSSTVIVKRRIYGRAPTSRLHLFSRSCCVPSCCSTIARANSSSVRSFRVRSLLSSFRHPPAC